MTAEERNQEIKALQKRLREILQENDLEKNLETFGQIIGRMSDLYGIDFLEVLTQTAPTVA